MTQLVLDSLSVIRANQALFDPISLSLSPASYLEVSGANGSGKTTLLRTLAGLYEQYDGVYEAGATLYCGHRLGLDPLLSPIENLQWLLHLSDQNEASFSFEQLVDALADVGLAERGLDPVGKLSQGQQRRVAMCWWSLSNAMVWLLDEPLNALDQDGRELVYKLVSEHVGKQGIVVCASHLPLQLTGDSTRKHTLHLRAPVAE